MKNGLFEEHFKDGTLSSVGEYIEGEKTGEWNELAQRMLEGNWKVFKWKNDRRGGDGIAKTVN